MDLEVIEIRQWELCTGWSDFKCRSPTSKLSTGLYVQYRHEAFLATTTAVQNATSVRAQPLYHSFTRERWNSALFIPRERLSQKVLLLGLCKKKDVGKPSAWFFYGSSQ